LTGVSSEESSGELSSEDSLEVSTEEDEDEDSLALSLLEELLPCVVEHAAAALNAEAVSKARQIIASFLKVVIRDFLQVLLK
jgi:hypothetical protein